MRLLAIDPGNIESAWLLYDTEKALPLGWAKAPNQQVLRVVEDARRSVNQDGDQAADLLAVEMVASFGMAVGQEIFDTCVWVGRFIERWGGGGGDYRLVKRVQVKRHLCGTHQAKDANIRAALIDKWGPGKDLAIGKKASPGPLYGLTGDCWSALAVAVTAAETPE